MYLNLYPDMSRKAYTGNDTFVFAAPIPIATWNFLYARPNLQVADVGQGKRVYYRMVDDVVIMLREFYHTDDDMLTAAARIRMVDKLTNMIYACPASNLTQAEIISRAAGSPRKLHKMLTIDEGED